MKKHMIVILSLFLTAQSHAWVAAGGHGGYYNGTHYYHHGYYYNEGWAAHGVVIGVPNGAYYGYGCRIVQICGSTGCENKRICE